MFAFAQNINYGYSLEPPMLKQIFEPRCEKTGLRGSLNPKFQASSHLVWSCSLVCVGPGREPQRPVFSKRGSKHKMYSPVNHSFACKIVIGGELSYHTKYIPIQMKP